MKAKKIFISALTVLSITTTGIAIGNTNAVLAKTKAAQVTNTVNYKAKHKVHVQGGWMYSSPKLTHKSYHMTKYLYTKFYATKKVTVNHNGKTATLKYLESKDGKVKGYVHSTYVWNKWSPAKYSVTAYRHGALTALNEQRKKQGLYALKESTKLDKIAQKNSNSMLKSGKKFKVSLQGTPHAGWVKTSFMADKNNYPILGFGSSTNWGKGTIYSFLGLTDTLTKNSIAKPYLLSKGHTHVGFGGTQFGQKVYVFILLSHK